MVGVPATSIIGGGPVRKRKPADFYATPTACTVALISVEGAALRRFSPVWEPACGDGAICRPLRHFDVETIARDLHARGYGQSGVDFLETKVRESAALVTNPPFSLAAEFIRHAWLLDIEYMALLLKATFWHAARRWRLFQTWPPSIIYPLLWRPDFDGRGAPTMDLCWVVWKPQSDGSTLYQPIPRPLT